MNVHTLLTLIYKSISNLAFEAIDEQLNTKNSGVYGAVTTITMLVLMSKSLTSLIKWYLAPSHVKISSLLLSKEYFDFK